MTEMMPRFSLIMPTKDRLQYIDEAINAVLAQDFTDWELVIKDAGLNNRVSFILPSDSRIKYEYMPQATFKEQMDSAFADAKGEILNFCADDDVMMPNALSLVNNNIGDAMWLYGKIKRNDGCGWTGVSWNYNACKKMNLVPVPAAFWRHEAVKYIGLPDVTMECYDWDYWLKLGARWSPVFLEEVLSYYRCHNDMGSITRIENVRQAENLIRNQAVSGYYDASYE